MQEAFSEVSILQLYRWNKYALLNLRQTPRVSILQLYRWNSILGTNGFKAQLFQYFNCIGGIYSCTFHPFIYIVSILQLYRWNKYSSILSNKLSLCFNTSIVSVEFKLFPCFFPKHPQFQYFNCIGGIQDYLY